MNPVTNMAVPQMNPYQQLAPLRDPTPPSNTSPPAPLQIIHPQLPATQYNLPLQPLPPIYPVIPTIHNPLRPIFQPSVICMDQPNFNPIAQRLLNLSVATGYDLIQQNGQRRFGPPPNWTGPPPQKGSEVFIGKIPRDMYEDELYPLFRAVGPVYEIRLMMNFSGFNRGFGFVTYCNPNDAWKAVEQLNNFEVRPDHKIGVSKSVDNCRLYIGGIPTDKTRDDAWTELTQNLQGITDIIMYPNRENRYENRGFMFVEFCTHRAAAMAKRKMGPGSVELWNTRVNVDWADPEPDINPNILSNVTKLFLRNISSEITDKLIRRLLLQFLPASAIIRIYIAQDYAFIHFDNRIHAQLAKDRLTGILYVAGLILDSAPIEVHWARPRRFAYTTTDDVQLSYCRSLPPRLRRQRKKSTSSEPGSKSSPQGKDRKKMCPSSSPKNSSSYDSFNEDEKYKSDDSAEMLGDSDN